MHKINHANIKDWAKNYKGELFDGILCDPPYELGFMGKSWDSSGIAFDSEMWADLLRLLKPGAHLLAFSGSRTYHRMAVAIEDAGFEIRDQLIWMYGSGFPKSLNIGKAVDRLQGNEREVTGIAKRTGKEAGTYGAMAGNNTETKGTSEWEGYGTALKPAHEPCVLARKPIDKGMTVAGNVLKHGTGGLNIDGTRVGTEQVQTTAHKTLGDGIKFGKSKPFEASEFRTGRFPANLIHDGSDEVVAVFPQTGASKATNRGLQHSGRHGGIADGGNIKDGTDTVRGHNDNGGSASRYFYTAKLTQEELDDTRQPKRDSTLQGVHTDTTEQPQLSEEQNGVRPGNSLVAESHRFYYCAKASKSERNAGLEGFEGNTQQTLIGNSPTCVDCNKTYNGTNNHNDCSGEMFNKPRVSQTNHHPTVKPLSLTKYLATLIKPPTGGRLLVPFSGSGSEMIGALQAGWEYVEGVELTEEYIPIAEARIKYWQNIPQTSSKPKVSAKNAEPVQNTAESLTLF